LIFNFPVVMISVIGKWLKDRIKKEIDDYEFNNDHSVDELKAATKRRLFIKVMSIF